MALPGEANYHLVDRWTVGHVGVGTWLGLLRVPWWGALVVAVGWEIIEQPLKRITQTPRDTFANAAVDALAVMAGWGAIRALPPQKRYNLRPTKNGFDPLQLKAGTRVEMEHTEDPRTAQTIAKHHLMEDRAYYTKLCKMWPKESGCEVLR
jgi:hypothetical protein